MMRIIREPDLEVTLDRSEVQDLHDFFHNHYMIPIARDGGRSNFNYPVYDKLVTLFKLLIDEQVERKDL